MVKNVDLPKYICGYDFILFTETFSDVFPIEMFSDYSVYISPSVKLGDNIHGRTCGGLALLVRKSLELSVKQIDLEYDSIMALKIHFKTQSDDDKTFILVGVYLPPENSQYYKDTDIYNGVSMLEDALLEIQNVCSNDNFIVFGDMNARTGECNNGGSSNSLSDIWDMQNKDACNEINADHFSKRVSKDKTINSFGKYLLDVCINFDLVILNGLVKNNFCGDFTYVTKMGCSTIDLFLTSISMVPLCKSLKVLPMIESKHAAVSMCVKYQLHNYGQNVSKENSGYVKFKWKEKNQIDFNNVVNSNESKMRLTEAMELIDTNFEAALSLFNDFLYKAGNCMKMNVNYREKPRNIWFDLECEQSRRVVRQHLRRFYNYNRDEDRLAYAEKRKQYKELLCNKKNEKKNEIICTLQENVNNSIVFWSCIQSVIRRKQNQCSITVQQWYEHFFSVFNSTNATYSQDDEFYNFFQRNEQVRDVDAECSELDDEITVGEVKEALKNLKNNKAAGPDQLINEFYKNSSEVITPFLVKFFNHIFDKGLFPTEWTLSILQPLHKKGDISDPDNYRGISLLNVCSKLYSYILNRRISDWVEEKNVLGEEQAGYRKNRSPIDQIFTLYAMISKQLVKHKKLYVAFIDFKKAFDGITRAKLWIVLRKYGIDGKMLRALRSMYMSVKTKVRVNGSLCTNCIDCPRGLKQGEICSPIIFSLYINELTKEILAKGKHGVQLTPDIVQILILLFADDIALISDSVGGLQTQLNILYDISIRLDLVVNLDKSNIVIFRNGGHLANIEKWTYGEKSLCVVNAYKYLGIILTTRLSFSATFEDLATRAKKGVVGILRSLWSIGDHTPSIFFKLFDSQIQPILTYGSEIWGLCKNQEAIEKIHLFALKRFLGVHTKTPRHLVYGDTGRYPLHVITKSKCIKFWLKLTRLNENRLAKKAYNMLLSLQKNNYSTWVDNVRTLLYTYGFGVVWEAQSVGSVHIFVKNLKQRLQDCAIQEWHSDTTSRDMYGPYSLFKTQLCIEPYLLNVSNFWHRRCLSRFRFGMTELNDSYLQFKTNTQKNKFCPFCDNINETEIHFLFICPRYDHLRSLLIPQKFYNTPKGFTMAILLASPTSHINRKTAEFIFKALNIRSGSDV